MNLRAVLLLSLGMVCLPACVMAQNEEKKEYWGAAEVYMQRQGARALQLVDRALTEYPPNSGNVLARRQALYAMDAILHNTIYDKGREMTQFLARRMESVLQGLRQPVEDGMQVYKLYNHGFIAQAGGVKVAFDLTSAAGMMDSGLLAQLVGECDMLCLSHNHGDHVDNQVVEMFLQQGKPVYAASEILLAETRVKHFYSMHQISHATEQLPAGEVRISMLHGHQDALQNNLYVVTLPGGYTICQTGDQYLQEDMDWIKSLEGKLPRIDVLAVICWSMHLQEVVNAFQPAVVLPGHENEIGHSIDHREAYWLSYDKFDQLTQPYILMTWGECYHFRR